MLNSWLLNVFVMFMVSLLIRLRLNSALEYAINSHILNLFQCADVSAKMDFVSCLCGVLFWWARVVSKGREKGERIVRLGV